MGDYADDAPPALLTEKRGGDEHPTEIADLFGKRLVVASETEKGRKLRLQLMKKLTGDGNLKGRFTRKDDFTFQRTFEPVLVTNNKPRIIEDTEAVWRRVRLVPFTVTIPPEERDTELPEKLKAEAPGILRWLVNGCLAWQRTGLDEPPAVEKATGAYRAESDPLRDFVEECCIVGPGYWTKSSDLREAYERFCKEQGEKPVDGKAFTESLKRQHNCKSARRNPGRGWAGIGLYRGGADHDGYEASMSAHDGSHDGEPDF